MHFELEVDVARDCHEFGIAGPPEDSMVRTLEVYDFKGECLLVVVHLVTERDRKSDRAEGRYLSCRDDPVERRM